MKIKNRKKMKRVSIFLREARRREPLLPVCLPKKGCLKYFICFVTALKSLKVYMYCKVKNNALKRLKIR